MRMEGLNQERKGKERKLVSFKSMMKFNDKLLTDFNRIMSTRHFFVYNGYLSLAFLAQPYPLVGCPRLA
jgi:hypothetical protein